MNNLVTRAREFAIKYHGDQKYGDKPYVYHLDCVFNKLSRNYNRELGVVAYLHDLLEDTDCEYEVIFYSFGFTVAETVFLLTKEEGKTYEEYIEKVKSSQMSLDVKIADTRANLAQSVLDNNKSRIVKYAKQLVLLES